MQVGVMLCENSVTFKCWKWFTYAPPDPDWFGSGNGDHHDLMDTTTEQHGRYGFILKIPKEIIPSFNLPLSENEQGSYGNSNSLFLNHEVRFSEIMPTMGKPTHKLRLVWVKMLVIEKNGNSGEPGIFVHNQLTDNIIIPELYVLVFHSDL